VTVEYIPYKQPAPIKGIDVSRSERYISPLHSPDMKNCEVVDGVLQGSPGYSQFQTGFPDANFIRDVFNCHLEVLP